MPRRRRDPNIEVIKIYGDRDMSAEINAILWKYRNVILGKADKEAKRDAVQQSKTGGND